MTRYNYFLLVYWLLLATCLTACGGATSPVPNTSTVPDPNNPGQVSYSLIATKESNGTSVPATLVLTQSVTVTMPATLSYVADAQDNNYVVLTLGTQYCDYENNGTTIYERLDGTCNSATPNAPIALGQGDTLSLYIESTPSLHAAVEAVIAGTL